VLEWQLLMGEAPPRGITWKTSFLNLDGIIASSDSTPAIIGNLRHVMCLIDKPLEPQVGRDMGDTIPTVRSNNDLIPINNDNESIHVLTVS
jgi:hypothetical protein